MILNETIDRYIRGIFASEKLKECFELRLHLLRTDYANKTPYERNEMDIEYLQTERNIWNLAAQIERKKSEFDLAFADLSGNLEKQNG